MIENRYVKTTSMHGIHGSMGSASPHKRMLLDMKSTSMAFVVFESENAKSAAVDAVPCERFLTVLVKFFLEDMGLDMKFYQIFPGGLFEVNSLFFIPKNT